MNNSLPPNQLQQLLPANSSPSNQALAAQNALQRSAQHAHQMALQQQSQMNRMLAQQSANLGVGGAGRGGPPMQMPPGGGGGPPPNGGGGNGGGGNGGMEMNGRPPGPPHQIFPSHPGHPQHAAWQAQQQQLALQQQQQRNFSTTPTPRDRPMPGGPGGPGGGPPPLPLPLRSATMPNQLPSASSSRPMSIPPQPPPSLVNPPPLPSTSQAGGGPPIGGPGGPIPMPMPPPAPPNQQQPPPVNQPPPPSAGQGSGNIPPGLGAHLAAIGAGPISATQLLAPSPALNRLYALTEALQSITANYHGPDGGVDGVRRVVEEFFTRDGVMKWGLVEGGGRGSPDGDGMRKVFEIPSSAFPRFHHINALCGVLTSSLQPAGIREYFLTCPDPHLGRPIHVGYLIRAENAIWTSKFSQGVKVDLEGTLSVHWVVTVGQGGAAGPLRCEGMEFNSRGYEEFVGKDAIITERIEKLFDYFPPSSSANGPGGIGGDDDDAASTSSSLGGGSWSNSGSSKAGNSASARKKPTVGTRRRSQTKDEEAELEAREREKESQLSNAGLGRDRHKGLGSVSFERQLLPNSPVGSFGITEMGMRCLEIAESVAQLQDLIGYAHEARLGPIEALTRFGETRQLQQQQQQQNPPLFPPHMQQPHPAPIASTSQDPSTNNFYSSAPPSAGISVGSPKRKLAPPRTPTPGLEEMVGGTPGVGAGRGEGSPNKIMRGAAGRGGRGGGGGRGRGG